MRLWHNEIIQLLPKSQLIAQWRELNSIFKKQDNHILINYIYNYDKQVLYNYTQIIIEEMGKRGYKIVKWENYNNYFSDLCIDINNKKMFQEQDDVYLKICVYNLYEKYIRGQKDFTSERWERLQKI